MIMIMMMIMMIYNKNNNDNDKDDQEWFYLVKTRRHCMGITDKAVNAVILWTFHRIL